MKTILVSGASGIVGYGILKSLLKSKEKYKLIGATIYNDSVAPAFCDIYEQALETTSPEYIDWICNVILKHEIDLIIPGIEADMIKWNRDRGRIEKTGVKVLLNNPELIEICSDKWLFYEKLIASESKLAIESRLEGTFEELKKNFSVPFLLKPRKGFASRGIIKVDNKDIFEQHKFGLGSTLLAQPIIGTIEDEYTISAFFDNTSRLICLMGLKRKLSKEGFTEKAEVIDVNEKKEAIQELAKIFRPVGPTNFQFRIQDNQLKLLEINPRISSATSIRTAFGYNESVMSVDYFINDLIPMQPEIKKGRAIRYTEDYIIYDSNNI